MSIQIVKFEPSKKARNNGAIALVIALEAPNKKAAEVMATGKLWEAYPAAADNFLKPEIVEDQPGCPRPAVGVFDEQFAIDNELNSELKCWQPRAVEAPPAGPVDLLKQPSKLKIAAVAMYGANEIDHSMLSLAQDLIDNDEPEDESGMLDIINGLNAVPAVGAMFPAAIETLIAAIINHFGEAVPTEAGAKDFAKKWVARPSAREKMVDDSSTSTAGTGGVSDYNTLSMHTALSIMAVHPATAKAGDVKNAKEIIASRDSVWRAWDKTFRVITGILDVDTDTRHSIISDGLKNLKLVNNDDERLHFVKSCLTGNPACPELANYGQQLGPQPEVESLGGGKFSVEGLIGEQPITDTNKSKKPENNIADKWQHGRLAWLYGEAIAALDGKTGVMDTHDVTELMANVNDGSSSHSYVSRAFR